MAPETMAVDAIAAGRPRAETDSHSAAALLAAFGSVDTVPGRTFMLMGDIVE